MDFTLITIVFSLAPRSEHHAFGSSGEMDTMDDFLYNLEQLCHYPRSTEKSLETFFVPRIWFCRLKDQTV